jgi:hypothetical protein
VVRHSGGSEVFVSHWERVWNRDQAGMRSLIDDVRNWRVRRRETFRLWMPVGARVFSVLQVHAREDKRPSHLHVNPIYSPYASLCYDALTSSTCQYHHLRMLNSR